MSARGLTSGAFVLGASATLHLGCGTHEVIPAHTFRVSIDIDREHSEATIAFPEHDPAAKSVPGDSSCSWRRGNCGYDEPTEGVVTPGTSTIYKATLTTSAANRSPTYELDFGPSNNGFQCRIYDNLSSREPRSCTGTDRSVIITFDDVPPPSRSSTVAPTDGGP
jgi:hypothetical protein